MQQVDGTNSGSLGDHGADAFRLLKGMRPGNRLMGEETAPQILVKCAENLLPLSWLDHFTPRCQSNRVPEFMAMQRSEGKRLGEAAHLADGPIPVCVAQVERYEQAGVRVGFQ